MAIQEHLQIKTKIVVTSQKGLIPFLKREIIGLNLPIISETLSSIETEGFFYDTMRLNLRLRTGHRVLFLIREFRCNTPSDLYKNSSKIKWEDYLDKNGYVCVTSSVDNPGITDNRFANLKVKDAIVDRIRKIFGTRPDSGPDRDRAVIHIFWKENLCSVYIDTSGEPLQKRGYRKIPFKAPMQETLCCATIMATSWSGDSHFINPMCGSGTLAIEAALIAANRAPGLVRDNYGFMHINGFEKNKWKELRKEAKKEINKAPHIKIIATDIDEEAIKGAKKNALTAGVDHMINFRVCDYKDTQIPEDKGIVVINPEYGRRLGEIKELEKKYKDIGDFFKKRCKGYMGYIFTGNLELTKKVGLRAKRRLIFFSSTIECRLLEYELY